MSPPQASTTAPAPRGAIARVLTFNRLKWASFAHSTVYFGLLLTWALGLDGIKYWLGWAHGIGWILMCIATLLALHARVIGMRIAVAVAVIGAVGPFVGSYEFVREQRRRTRRAAAVTGRYSQGSDGS